jgi:hypothetical protein
MDVFISYPRATRSKIEPIKAKLEGFGLDIFFDLEGIDGGENFPDAINRALSASKSVLCCWSPLYFKRTWCMIECRYGFNHNILVPVVVEEFDQNAPPADLQQVNRYSLVDWKGEDLHEDWNRTLLRIGKLVKRELAPPLKRTLSGELRLEGATPAAPKATQVRADILTDLRATWANFPGKTDADTVRRFLERVRAAAPGSGLEFEVEHHHDKLDRVGESKSPQQNITPSRWLREMPSTGSLRLLGLLLIFLNPLTLLYSYMGYGRYEDDLLVNVEIAIVVANIGVGLGMIGLKPFAHKIGVASCASGILFEGIWVLCDLFWRVGGSGGGNAFYWYIAQLSLVRLMIFVMSFLFLLRWQRSTAST